ncbi:MAG: lactonase family protein [Chloroflexi bacterium]|nr:lactonase family protein [Chloroflexota bacterium]
MAEQRFIYVGTYTEPIRFGTGQILEGKGRGIHILRLDMETGALTPCSVAEGVRNPSFVAFHPSRRFLYAVNELKEFQGAPSGAVSAFAIHPESGELTFLNSQATHGTDPCHVTVDPMGRVVLVANFASGSVCALPILADGSLGEASDFVQHHGSSADPVRQAGPHAHAVTLDASGRMLFVPDLGLDRVMIYRLDAQRGTLKPNDPPWVSVPAGSGPRQIAFHPSGAYAYLINELNSTIIAFRYDASRGALEPIQTVPTLPYGYLGKSTTAEVQITPDGRYLYGSNRGHDSIAMYAIDPPSGILRSLGQVSSQGRIPRHFTVDPTGRFALVANQDTDNLVVFRVDGATGALTLTGHTAHVPTPVCVQVL